VTLSPPRHEIIPMAELVRDLSPAAQELAIPAIQRVLNWAHHYDERMDEARDIAANIEGAEHNHEPGVDTVRCYRCWLYFEEQRVLGAAERSKGLLEGRRNG
jgi:hypothetical protein